MWLRFLHWIGMTNLSDQEIAEMRVRRKANRARAALASDEQVKEALKRADDERAKHRGDHDGR